MGSGRFAADMTGQRFGRLTVIDRAENDRKNQACWRCRCDCGNVTVVAGARLRRGTTKSCGCYFQERRREKAKTHGGRHERLYGVWYNMRQRCENAKEKSYPYYGGRGIRVCDEWRDYATFREWALANGYDPEAEKGKCTIDRIDVNGNYEPTNCRWVSMAEQNSNKRRTKGAG